MSPLIIGAVAGSFVFIVIIATICIVMKYKSKNDRKNRRNSEPVDFTEKQWIPVNAPPIGTSLPPDYKRGLSIVSLEWTDNSRANTPVDLFTVKGYN